MTNAEKAESAREGYSELFIFQLQGGKWGKTKLGENDRSDGVQPKHDALTSNAERRKRKAREWRDGNRSRRSQKLSLVFVKEKERNVV
jgi:hypothetical protein